MQPSNALLVCNGQSDAQSSDLDQCLWQSPKGRIIIYFPMYLFIVALVGFLPDLIIRLKFVPKYVFLFKLGTPSKKKKKCNNCYIGGGLSHFGKKLYA